MGRKSKAAQRKAAGIANAHGFCHSESRISELIPDAVKAVIDLPIVARPTLDSREVLTRIAQKETRRVMVFKREREKRRDI